MLAETIASMRRDRPSARSSGGHADPETDRVTTACGVVIRLSHRAVTNSLSNEINKLDKFPWIGTIYSSPKRGAEAKMLLRLIFVAFCVQQAWSQTQIDLQAQSRNVDFSTAATTRPMKSGTALPGTCSVGEMFFLTNAAAGANLYGCGAANAWTLESSGSGGGGGSTVQNASQLADLGASINSQTTLTIGATCSATTPCNVRLGSVTFSFTSATSATITSGSGTAFIYIDNAGNLTVGNNLAVTCSSGCRVVPGVTAFPPDSIPLFTWTATNGAWDTAGRVDRRAFQSTTNVSAGTGLLATTANGATTLAIDPTLLALWAAVPSTSSSACTPGA